MTGKSGVYLVSSSQVRGQNMEKTPYDNQGYTGSEPEVAYNATTGIDLKEVHQYPDKPYRGMGKEDLLHFSSQPFWRRLRMICIAIIVLGWLALVITVIALVLAYPKCRDPAARSWWQNEAVYRIYVPSFKDSDGNGIGDLKGVESKLNYVNGLGFGVISLSPFYQTAPLAAGETFKDGNDMAVTDHKAIGSDFGTMADFDSLIKAAHTLGMYVILDFIPNLTSKQHPWFTDSSGGTSAKRNYYVWASGNASSAPNNWQNMYTPDGAWTRDAARGQWYLHQFHGDTPDLNLRSAMVQQELEDILNFWLDKEVDGFYVRDTSYLYEDYDLRDDPAIPGASGTGYSAYNHIYTSNQPESYSILDRWRQVLRHNNKTTTEKLLMTDTTGGMDVMMLYGDCDKSGSQMPTNRDFTGKQAPCDGACVRNYVNDWMKLVPSGKWANWMSSDDNSARFASRFNTSYVPAFTMLSMLLPGTPIMYYGDELNMENVNVPGADPWRRQQAMRSLMQWENSTNGGFCNGTCGTPPWTSLGDVSAGNAKMGNALTGLIKDLTSLRREPSFHYGDYFHAVMDNEVFSFVREFDGETGYLVAINFGPTTVTRNFKGSHDTIQEEAVVSLSYGTKYSVDDEVDTGSLDIAPYGGLVVSWDYVAKDL